MSISSNKSQRILDWLSSCDREGGSKVEPTKKRKLDMDDATPTAKRQAIGIATPSLSNRGSPERRNLFESAPSLHSSNATSRSSSPSKRQRPSEIEFSNPSVEFYSAFRLPSIRDEAEIPSWTELMNAIAIRGDRKPLAQTTLLDLELDKICKNIGYCEQRDGNEDAWCELVVHPILLLAGKLSRNSRYIDVLNVKSIDIHPRHLLPQIECGSSLPTKRVDYSIGLEFTTHNAWKETVRRVQDRTLNQSKNKMIRDRILCSHIEVKTSTGGSIEGRNQLALWCAAGFKKLDSISDDLHDAAIAPSAAPMPLWLWTGRDLQLFVAMRRADTIHVLDKRQWKINDKSALRDVLATLVRVMDWGWECYRPWFLRLLGQESVPLPGEIEESI